LINYLNREDVQTALHTKADVTWTRSRYSSD
jgi:hypothetical protein